MAFENALYLLDQIGFTDVFLPFILIFTIIFAVLQKIKLFGDESRKFNSIISLALAIGVIIPHSLNKYPPGTDIVQILNTALPNISLFIVAVVFLLIIIGMFGGEAKWSEGWTGGIVTIAALGIIVFIFGNAAGWWEAIGVMYFLSDSNVQAALLIIFVFWLVVSVISTQPEEPSSIERIGKFFGIPTSSEKSKEGGK